MKRSKAWLVLLVLWVGLDAWLANWWWDQRREQRAEALILAAAKRHSVEPALVKAVVWRESRFKPGAVGTSGELGLMQVGALAAKEWAEAERMTGFDHGSLLDPARNTQAGTWYLAKLLKRYARTDNPPAFALADYNAGRVNVLRWAKGVASTNSAEFLAGMDFPGTRDYVRSILARAQEYRGVFPRPGS